MILASDTKNIFWNLRKFVFEEQNMNELKKLYLQLNNDNIIDEVRQVIENMISERIENLYYKAKETHKIWKGEGKDQRWKFKKSDGTIVAKTHEKDIKTAYCEYLKEGAIGEQTSTFGELYSAWLEYKKAFVGIEGNLLRPNTYRRYQRDYARFVLNTYFEKKSITSLTPMEFERFLTKIIKEHELTVKAYTNFVGYLKNCMLYAQKSGLCNSNPILVVDHLSLKKLCKVVEQNDKDRILSNEDMIDLIYILHEKQENGKYYIQNYAIELATLTGMRVGEIAALKWESITDECIKIDFSEHRIDYDDKTCEYYIGEPKNKKHREFPMSDEIKDLFKRIKAVQKRHGIVNEYVFADKNGRVNSHTISCAMNRRCEDAGIDTKSIHAIRRTVSSHLRKTLPIATVCAMLGHTEETNVKHYSYDVEPIEKKLKSLKAMYKNFQDASLEVA